MTPETEQAVERLEADLGAVVFWSAETARPLAPVGADDLRLLLTALAHSEGEVRDLKSSVVTFCAPHAARYAEDFGLPPGHLHPTHYDLLERCGARMDDFTRATNKTEE